MKLGLSSTVIAFSAALAACGAAPQQPGAEATSLEAMTPVQEAPEVPPSSAQEQASTTPLNTPRAADASAQPGSLQSPSHAKATGSSPGLLLGTVEVNEQGTFPDPTPESIAESQGPGRGWHCYGRGVCFRSDAKCQSEYSAVLQVNRARGAMGMDSRPCWVQETAFCITAEDKFAGAVRALCGSDVAFCKMVVHPMPQDMRWTEKTSRGCVAIP